MQINRKHKRQYTKDGEAGFTLIEMIIVIVIASILGGFIFQILTKSLGAQIAMQNRKERDDDAILVSEKISREIREAKNIVYAGNNQLVFEKNVTSSTDTNTFIQYVRDIPTKRLMRQSAATLAGFPGNSTSGNIVAEHVTVFTASTSQSYGSSVNLIDFDLVFAEPGLIGSEWNTKVQPRNYGL